MVRLKLGGIAALALLVATPVLGQPSARWDRGPAMPGWDRNEFWRDAPRDVGSRIDFMQRRIDRGIADGSINRREARSSQDELNRIRWEYRRFRGRLTLAEESRFQARLDDLGSRIRWQRQAGGYGDRTRYDDRSFSTDYDARRYYRDGPGYRERRLTAEDEVYRGSDGRYYCKRSDGTTGLVIGALGGAVVGNVLDGGRNRTAGTLLGGALGALAGVAIDQNSDVRCR